MTVPPPNQGPYAAGASSSLEFHSVADLCKEVDDAPPTKFLLRRWWPSGDYGVHAAGWKAQKTWNAVDMAVAVASGTRWLGAIDVDDPGPVILFLGEGGKRNVVRRLRAVCDSHDLLRLEDLPIHVCVRAPHLGDRDHLDLMAEKIAEVGPKQVTIDPLYLAAGGANGRDLDAMGDLLEGPQHVCAEQGAALLVVTHFNRSKDNRGSSRITGAGPAEWGRVLITAETVTKSKNEITQETTVVSDLDLIGGEVADQALRIRRKVRAERPDDLDSPFLYSVETLEREVSGDDGRGSKGPAPAERKVLEALATFDRKASIHDIGDVIADTYGSGLKRNTISGVLNDLLRAGLVLREDGAFGGGLWCLKERPS